MRRHITGISSMATRQVLADLAGLYGQRSGCTVTITSLGGVDAARQVRAGTTADIVILASPVMEKLEVDGHIVAGSRSDIAQSGIAMAVRSGVKHPVINDEAAVKQAMLTAGQFGYSTGPSGDHLKSLWKRWGIADAMAQRAIQAPAGVPVGDLLARGDIDIGLQQTSELLNIPGVEIVGPLPPEIQATTIFTAGIVQSSLEIEAARNFIAFLIAPETASIKHKYGMDTPH